MVILTGIIVANKIGADAFAAFTFVHLTAASFSTIALFGTQQILPRYFASFAVGSNATIRVVIAFIIALSGLTFAVIIVFFLGDSAIGNRWEGIKLYLILLIFGAGLNNLLTASLNGLECYSPLVKASILQVIIILLGLGYSIMTQQYLGVIVGYAISTIASVVILFYYGILKNCNNLLRFNIANLNLDIAKEVFVFSLTMFGVSVLTNSAMWISGRTLLSDKNTFILDFSIFSLGLQWFGIVTLASAVLARVVLPKLTHSSLLDDMRKGKEIIFKGVMMSLMMSLVIFIFVFYYSDYILALYGDELASAGLILIIFAFAGVVESPINILSSVLVAYGHKNTQLLVVTIWWLSLMLLLLLSNGVLDVAKSILISYVIYLFTVFYFTKRVIRAN